MRLLSIAGGIAALAVVTAWVVPPLVDLEGRKPGLERAASEALGMDVRIRGKVRIGLLPSPRITAEAGRIIDERGVPAATAKRVRLDLALLPLLRGSVRLSGIEVTRPVLAIERDPAGRLNVERMERALALLGALEGTRVSIVGGTVRYAHRGSGKSIELTGLEIAVRDLHGVGGRDGPTPGGLSMRARLGCASLRIHDLLLTGVKATVVGTRGVITCEPVTMRAFGGTLTGTLRADLSGTVPDLRVACTLPGFRLEEFLAALAPSSAATGAMDFSANLAMRGATPSQLVQHASGSISLRGRDLRLEGTDLDRAISRYASSQRFNLVDVGAVFFAGPMGLAVTRGYGFASLLRGTEGASRIGTLVSDWTVEGGVARATDVALATDQNRIALQGSLDFVQERYVDVTVAVVDVEGCARVRQELHGPFDAPVVEKPRVLTSLAGPVLGLVRQTRKMLPHGPCEPFYSGGVAAPR